MGTLRNRVEKLEERRNRCTDARSMTDAELEEILIEYYGYLPNDHELQAIAEGAS